MTSFFRLRALFFLFSALHAPAELPAQLLNTLGSSSNAPNSGQTDQAAVALNGVVLNAMTNQPVARALVQAGSQASLTEHDGKFQFTDASGSSTSLRVTKPGFYDSPDPNSSAKRVTFGSTADPVRVYLYPEALLTGTVTATNGESLANVSIQALRKSGDESGSVWTMAGQASTNSDGQFRIPLRAGDYVLETQYMPDRPVRRMALLPMLVPDAVSGSGEGSQAAIHLDSGTEQHLDLRPDLRPMHDVHIQSDEVSGSAFLQIEAHLSNGLFFYPNSRPGGIPGEFIASLPTGTYTLTTMNSQGDAAGYAQTTVNVGDSDVSGVVLRTVRSLPLPVEVLVDTSEATTSTSDNQPPSAQQLSLRFVRTDRGAPAVNESAYLRVARGETAAFNLTPGKYHLLAQPLSHWYIASATIGGADLLTQDFAVDSGGTSAPLRIVVSNNTASIKGTVKLDGSPGVGCWVYLVAATRGVTPTIYATSGSDGTFSRASIPPGSYRAVAFETRRSADFSDSATLDRLAPYMKSLTVAPGEMATVDIDAIPSLELKR